MTRIGVWSMGTGVCAVLGFSVPVSAQVIEIGRDGQTNVYAGPTQFDAEGSRAIVQPAPMRERRVSTNPTAQAATRAGLATGVSPALIEAVAWQESRFRARVVSPAGAIGEMQLMPATARALGVDPYDSEQNYQGGALYLARLMRRYRGDLVLSLAAYNAGPGAVDRWRGVPPYRETRAYVGAVLGRLGSMVEGAAPKFKQRNDR